MSAKYRKAVLFFALFLFSSAVIAAVEPKNVVIFFLPVRDSAEINSPQEAVPTPLPVGVSAGIRAEEISKKDENQEKHGINTPLGVSLYDKGNVPLKQAVDNILAPARVLILPPETAKKGRAKSVSGLPESVTPDRIRVFPMQNPAADMKNAARERPVVIHYQKLKPPDDTQKERPNNESEWTGWVLRQLQDCSMDAQTVLPTLYWLAANRKLTDGKTDCDMKTAVTGYLRKCHPWPVVYYTPVNNDVPVRPAVQMAAEFLENTFDSTECPALDLSGVNFEKTDFLEGSLKNTDFSNSYFQEATFSGVDLSGAVFNGAKMDNVLFQNVDLSGALFEKTRMKYAHLHRVNADGVRFDSADLQNTQFRDVNFSLSSFNNAVLQNTAWFDVRAYRMKAYQADFSKAGFDNVLFNQLQARKANFERISCKECVFDRAVLQETSFFRAFFDKASFDRSYLSHAQFRSAVFENDISFDDAYLYKADFKGVDLRPLNMLPIEKLTQLQVDRRTVLPDRLSDFDSAVFDVELDNAGRDASRNVSRYACSKRTCEERLLGRATNQNLAVRAMTMLSDPEASLNNQVWALCTMGCIAKNDKKLENSQIDILTAFIKRRRPWNSATDLFKPYTPVEPEVQMALYILTDPQLQRDLGHDVDLTGTDLRTADLSGSDLRTVNLSGSHLGGTNLRRAKTDQTFTRFDQAVIDEFTLFPAGMEVFKPFRLPDSITPPWWKPGTVRVIRDGSHLWTVTTEDIPFSDKLIVSSEKQQEEKK